MKGSTLASLIGYEEAVKWNRERLESCTDVFICPSSFMSQKMAQGGFDTSKLKVLCNFMDVDKCRRADYQKEDYYCFVGRLSHEKGARTLVEAANQLPFPVKIIGGGPLMEELKALAHDNVEFVGFKQWDDIKELVGRARFTVIPSEWYENNPMSVIEAECLGTPVLGARIGGIPELIDEGVNGMTFESRNMVDLREKISQMYDTTFDYESIAATAMSRYGAGRYYDRLMEIYKTSE